MAPTCAWCRSGDMQALTDRWQCLECARWTGINGEKYDQPGPYNTGEVAPQADGTEWSAVDPYDERVEPNTTAAPDADEQAVEDAQAGNPERERKKAKK